MGLDLGVVTLLRYFIIFTNKDFIPPPPPQSPTKHAQRLMSVIVSNAGRSASELPNMGQWQRASWVHTLTSFSPQILLMMELEAGLAEGPRTATTPLDMIWHTERKQRGGGEERSDRDGEREGERE